MIYIGIDPGKKGGYAIIDEAVGNTVRPWDDDEFAKDMSIACKEPVIACIEQVHAMPGQGVTSMFNFGKSVGFIYGVLTGFGIPYQTVPPKKWKGEFSLGKDKKQAIETCKRLYPDIYLKPTHRCSKDSDGMAEAMLIATYCKRHY